MSDEAPITITIKAGPGHDDPWHVLRASSVPDAERALEAVISSRIMELTLSASSLFKATKNAEPLTRREPAQQQEVPAAPVTPGPWPGSPAPAPQANFQQSAQPGAHPEGKRCLAGGCGQPLVYGTTRNGKGQWKCPQHRSVKNADNSWGDNGHTMEWAR